MRYGLRNREISAYSAVDKKTTQIIHEQRRNSASRITSDWSTVTQCTSKYSFDGDVDSGLTFTGTVNSAWAAEKTV